MGMKRLKQFFFLTVMVSMTSAIIIYCISLQEIILRIESYNKKVEAEKEDWDFQRKVFWADPQNRDIFIPSEEDTDYLSADEFDVAYEKAVNTSKIVPPKNESSQKRLPDAIIVGVPKCGTRALLTYLTLSRYVVAAGPEIDFFNKHFDKGIQWYKEQMPMSYSNQITMEKSPGYFECVECPTRIYNMKKSTKILILLRDPVERLISQYMQLVDKFSSSPKQFPPFEEWVKDPKTGKLNIHKTSIKISIYADHVKRWHLVFPRSQILIIDGNKLSKDPLPQIREIETFLGIPHYITQDDLYYNHTKGFYCMRNRVTGKTGCLGETKGRWHIRPDNTTMSELYKFYKPHNMRLKDLLGYWMSWF